MRALKLCLLALSLGVSPLVQGSDFDAANELYDQGKFTEARSAFAQLVTRGPWSANLFYNLGNADFRLKDTGRAILNYERALLLDPTHPEAQANLRLLREQTGAKLPAVTWREHAFPGRRLDVFVVVATVAAWAAVFFLYGLITTSRREKSGLWLGAVASLLLAGYAAAAIWHLEEGRTMAIVTSANAEAHGAPADSAQKLDALPAGSQVRVLRERGDWIYCVLPGQARGWIPARALERVRI